MSQGIPKGRGASVASANVSDEEYEIVEEEVPESLDDDTFYEEEVIEDKLPGISEEEEEIEVEVDDGDDGLSQSHRSTYSMTEVEIRDEDNLLDKTKEDDSSDEVTLELEDGDELLLEEEYVDDTIRDDESDIDEVTIREDDIDYQDFEKQVTEYDTSPEDSTDEEDEDGASAEELTEAIEYILRQEKAVASFILTEEQAEKMAHLPVRVMKVIVDHLEVCDNAGTPIDWDFLLKIVLPYLDEDDDDDDNEERQQMCVGPCNCRGFCVELTGR